jgi:hypothetical protein
MVIPTHNYMADIYYFIRTQPCWQVHSENHNYSKYPYNPNTQAIRPKYPCPMFFTKSGLHRCMFQVAFGMLACPTKKNICQIGYSNPVTYTDTRILDHVAQVKPCTDYYVDRSETQVHVLFCRSCVPSYFFFFEQIRGTHSLSLPLTKFYRFVRHKKQGILHLFIVERVIK